MKYRIGFVVAVLLVSGLSPRVLAQDDSSDGTTPAQRCGLAQNYLKNIQKPRDLRARVDRLQAYQYIYQRLDVFVARLQHNNQPEAADLRASLDRLNKSTQQFKTDYESYDTAREAVVKVKDCQENFADFTAKLADAREKVATVGKDVDLIDSILSPNIKSQLGTLYQQLLISGKSGTSND